jgi:hypothetical protein
VLPGEPDALWAQCDLHAGARMAKRQARERGV